MKKILMIVIASLFLLSGCASVDAQMDCIMELREKLLKCQSCRFTAEITADYGDNLHIFTLDCQTDQTGDLSFTVMAPQSIAGITGAISDESGTLTFDDQVLTFAMLADEQLTPVSAPWLFVKTLRSGYISSCGQWDQGIKAVIDDSYEDELIQVSLWLDMENSPAQAEFVWKGRRILSLTVKDFSCE